MTRSRTLHLLLALAVAAAFSATCLTNALADSSSIAQDEEAIRSAVGSLTEVVRGTYEMTKYGFCNDRYCLLGKYLQPDGSASTSETLKEGEHYVFIATCSDVFADVQIRVVDADGKTVGEDDSRAGWPLVAFDPPSTGKYTVTMKLTEADESAFCALAILRGNGVLLSSKVTYDALSRFETAVSTVSEAFAKKNSSVAVCRWSGTWALMGSVGAPGAGMTMSGLSMETGRHVFVCIGDLGVREVNLSLLDSEKAVLKTDDDHKCVVMFQYPTSSDVKYGLKTDIVKAPNGGLVLTGVLDAS